MLFNIPDNMWYNSGIYSITNSIDSRFYIGSTICFRRRFLDHRSSFKKKKHANPYLQSFVNKYGLETISFNILYPCKNTCLVYNEKLWIENLKPQFNIKKIINRPYFADELAFNQTEMFKNHKSPLCFLIEKYGQDWWDSVIANSHKEPEPKYIKRVTKEKVIRPTFSKKEHKKHLLQLIKEFKKN